MTEKIECSSFCKNSDNSNEICRACSDEEIRESKEFLERCGYVITRPSQSVEAVGDDALKKSVEWLTERSIPTLNRTGYFEAVHHIKIVLAALSQHSPGITEENYSWSDAQIGKLEDKSKDELVVLCRKFLDRMRFNRREAQGLYIETGRFEDNLPSATVDTQNVRRVLAEVDVGVGTPEYAFNALSDITKMCEYFEGVQQPDKTVDPTSGVQALIQAIGQRKDVVEILKGVRDIIIGITASDGAPKTIQILAHEAVAALNKLLGEG